MTSGLKVVSLVRLSAVDSASWLSSAVCSASDVRDLMPPNAAVVATVSPRGRSAHGASSSIILRQIRSPCRPASPAGHDATMRRLLYSPRLRLAGGGVALAAGSVTIALLGGPNRGTIAGIVAEGGVAAPIIYVALTLLLFPGSVMTAVGGALFGAVLGTLLTIVAATAAATGAFVIGRRLGRAEVERIAGRRISAIDRWLSRRGLLAVLYLRLFPIIPFNAFNYAAGVTGVTRRDYVLGTAVGIVPGTFAYAALGGSIDDPTSPAFLGAVGALVALGVAAPLVNRFVGRRAPELPDRAAENG